MNNGKTGDFDPNAPYSINEAARIIGKSVQWVKDNPIREGKLQFAPMGDNCVIMGRWITDYVISIGAFKGEAHCPTSNRGKSKQSPRKKTTGGESTS